MLDFVNTVRERGKSRSHAIAINARQPLVCELLSQWKRALPNISSQPLPTIADILVRTEIREVIEQPTDIQVTKADVEAVFTDIDAIVDRWRTDTLDILKTIAGVENESDLRLARSALVCQDCSKVARADDDYPSLSSVPSPPMARPLWPLETFTHSCMNKDSDGRLLLGSDQYIPSSAVLHVGIFGIRHPFKHAALARNEKIQVFAEMIIRAMGLDVAVATVEDMDELRILVECKQCSPPANRPQLLNRVIPYDEGDRNLLLLDWRCWVRSLWLVRRCTDDQ